MKWFLLIVLITVSDSDGGDSGASLSVTRIATEKACNAALDFVSEQAADGHILIEAKCIYETVHWP